MESRELAVGYNRPVVEGEELGRRLKALRELRGISQVAFGEMLAAEGFGKHDIGRVERGGMAMQGALRREAARLLRVPEDVFVVDDVDAVLWQNPDTQLNRIEQAIGEILSRLPEQDHEAEILRETTEGARQDALSDANSGASAHTADQSGKAP
jgi:transcriptional regulator with XRE-family HTH domain